MAETESVFHLLCKLFSAKREYLDFSFDPNPVTKWEWSFDLYQGRCQNKDNGEIKHIVVKVIPVTGLGGIYRNEVYFYSRICPDLNLFQKEKKVRKPFVNTPRYIAEHLTEREQLLFMENIKAAGYESFDGTGYLNSEHLKMIFQILGKFHALSFAYKDEHPKYFTRVTNELLDITKLEYKKMPAEFVEATYKASIDMLSVELNADVINRLRRIENFKEILAKARNYQGKYSCLTHGKCCSGNMLFKYKESGELEDVKLIDFQLIYVSTPVYDLSYFFYSGAAKTDMDKVDYYLEIYYDSFSSFVRELGGDPQKIYPFAVLKDEWKKYSLIGMLIGIGMWVGKLMDKDEIISLISRKDLPKKDYFELWNAKMSEVRKASTFRQRARDICLHAIEYGVL